VEVEELEVHVTSHGDVPEAAKQYAIEKLRQLAHYTKKPILYVQVKLTLAGNPSRERPALAEASFDVNGRQIRAHVAAHDFTEAVDLLVDRLRRRLDRSMHRTDPQHRPHHGAARWHHGDLRTARPEYFDRPVDEREIVRHKTFALEPMTCEEAAFDLELLGHDFYLFTDLETGADSVLFHPEEGDHLELIQAADENRVPASCSAFVVASTQHPVEMTISEARERLDITGERFVFFVNTETGRGNVIYRRYDGHYGLITPA
jgi:ribosomal subunit interface protein